MIQAVLEVIGEWLLSGSDKGLVGKIRKWLLIVLGSLFGLALVFIYYVKLESMSLGLAIALPIFAVFFSGIGFATYSATRLREEKKDRN